jgi:hypothetical protein
LLIKCASMKGPRTLLSARSGMGAITVVAVSLFPACNYMTPCERGSASCKRDGSVEASAVDTPSDANQCPVPDDADTDAEPCGILDGSAAGS